MVTLHTAFLGLMLIEVLFLETRPTLSLTLSMLILALFAQALRWWCIHALGHRWNPRIIVIPGLAPVVRGPYRWLKHPNYMAVVLEGFALPLVHAAWRTAAFFTIANALLLVVRIGSENQALQRLEGE